MENRPEILIPLTPNCFLSYVPDPTAMAIVISEFLECHSKAKRARASAYSRALRRIKGVVQRVVHGKLRSDFQGVRGDRVAVKAEAMAKQKCANLGRG